MKDKLLIVSRIKKTVSFISKIVENFPNKEMAIKSKIISTGYEMIELAYYADLTTDIDDKRKLVIKVKMYDYLLNIACDKGLISYKKYLQTGTHLNEIVLMIYGWMKSETKKNLYDNILNMQHIIDVILEVSRNTKNKHKVEKYHDFYTVIIYRIYITLKNRRYKPGKYNIFMIREPKIRIVMSQSIFDKVINHLVSHYILNLSLENHLIDTNVATRTDKCTHYGMKKVKLFLNKLKEFDLELNSKTMIINCKSGFNFLGFNYKIDNNKII